MTSEVPVRGGSGVGAGGDEAEFNGSILRILTIVLAAVSFVIVVLRGVARHRFGRGLELTDILLPTALVLAIVQTCCVELALTSGLGSHFSSLSTDQVSQYFKLTYASNILFQVVVSLTQAIVVLLVKGVEPQRPVRIGCSLLLGVIGIYSILALLYHGFQCALPEPWLVASDRCLDREVYQASITVVSIVIDAATLLLPIMMMWNVKTSMNRKVLVCTLFGTRIALPLVTIPQFQLLHTALTSQDPTWDTVSWQMWIQIIMNVSIITACLPSFGRMMWELWAFGSNLKSAPSLREPGSRDFGHELGLGHDQLQEKADYYRNEPTGDFYRKEPTGDFYRKEPTGDFYRNEPGPAVFTEDEKYNLKFGEQIVVQVREYGSFDSDRTAVDLQKELPPSPSSRTKHHYRRPASLEHPPPPAVNPSPRLPTEAPPYMAMEAKEPATTGATLRPPQPTQGNKYTPYSSVYSDLPPLRSQASGSFYDDEDMPTPVPVPAPVGRHDIDSYYSGDPTRTEVDLQKMIDDLQRQNSPFPQRPPSASIAPGRNMEGGWI